MILVKKKKKKTSCMSGLSQTAVELSCHTPVNLQASRQFRYLAVESAPTQSFSNGMTCL